MAVFVDRPNLPTACRQLLAASAAILLGAPLLAPVLAQGGAPPPDLFLPPLGRTYLAAHCPDGATEESCTLEGVLASDYAYARLGIFDLWYPAWTLGEARQKLDLIEIGDALLSLQRVWVQMVAGDSEASKAVLDDLATVQGWVAKWDAAAIGQLPKSKQRDLLVALNASPEVSAAATRLKDALMSRETFQMAPQFTTGVGMVFCPTRRDLMELMGFVGLTDEGFRKAFWIPGIDQYTSVWHGEKVLVALQYAPWSGFEPQFNGGIPVGKFSPGTGFKEYVIQQAAEAMLFRNFNDVTLRLQEKSLAVNLVIEVLKRINTLDTDGGISSSGATTQPYERFVPGGASEGGVLPAVPAAPFDTITQSRWRDGFGMDFFLKPLRDGQKAGAKAAAKDKKSPLAKDKRPHFELQAMDGRKMVVQAPFLGPLAYKKPYPPPEFLNDFREFYRSYNACFLHWLRTHGQADKAASEESFRQLLLILGEQPMQEKPEDPMPVKLGFHEALEKVYGCQISSMEADDTTLEWRFLKWVSGAK